VTEADGCDLDLHDDLRGLRCAKLHGGPHRFGVRGLRGSGSLFG
jgi:hypothetical protein